MTPDVLACLPAKLHPVSRLILEESLHGRLTRDDFLWGFRLPNADYLGVAQRVLRVLGA